MRPAASVTSEADSGDSRSRVVLTSWARADRGVKTENPARRRPARADGSPSRTLRRRVFRITLLAISGLRAGGGIFKAQASSPVEGEVVAAHLALTEAVSLLIAYEPQEEPEPAR